MTRPYDHIIILSTAKTLYSGYTYIFLFDNVTRYFVYAKIILHIRVINKSSRNKYSYAYNNWYNKNGVNKIYQINIQRYNRNWTQKIIQKLLE